MSAQAFPILAAAVQGMVAVGIGLALACAVRWAVEPRVVTSASMEPALRPGDRVLSLRTRRAPWRVRPGDVVVLADPERPRRTLVKRVIAPGGSTVEIVDGVVLVEGTPVRLTSSSQGRSSGPFRVPAASLFVLGDNLPLSRDSRDFGPVPCDSILARAEAVYWPPRRIGLVTRERLSSPRTSDEAHH